MFKPRRISRTVIAIVTVAVACGGVIVATSAASEAATWPTFTVMNTSEALPDGVYFRNSPSTNDTSRTVGLGVKMNEQVQLQCYAYGQSVGSYGNTLWYYALNVSRLTNNGIPNRGMLNAHYINDGKAAGVRNDDVPACVNNRPPSVTPCVNNVRWPSTSLTFSYSGNHRYYGNAWQAAKDWTDLDTGIKINPAASGKTGDIVFDDVTSKVKTFAAAQMPAEERVQTTIPSNPIKPTTIHILVNRTWMDILDDPHKTATLAHEIGHALGLAHSNYKPCTITAPSIMQQRGSDVPTRSTVAPQYYDKINLEQLYGLPTG